nr:Plug domain-containing protein [Glaciimonas sp. PCH181]
MAPIVVEGHYDNAVGTSDASSLGVIRGDLLQDLPLLRPGEVLETVPGLVVTQHSGDGKANQYFLRGYNLDHGTDFATNVDGVPLNMIPNAASKVALFRATVHNFGPWSVGLETRYIGPYPLA